MKKSIVFIFVYFISVNSFSQKIHLKYHITTSDSIYEVYDFAFSDKEISENASKHFGNLINHKEIINIQDNTGRLFIKSNANSATKFNKVLSKGQFNLLELTNKKNSFYRVISTNESYDLICKDSIIKNKKVIDRSYTNQLVSISKEYPELWENAYKCEFNNKSITNFIDKLNLKYDSINKKIPRSSRLDFINISVKGFYGSNRKDLNFDIKKSFYFINYTPNVSFSYGIKLGFMTINDMRSTYYMLFSSGVFQDNLFYNSIRSSYFQIPFSITYSINKYNLTPYFSFSYSPTFFINNLEGSEYPYYQDNIKKFSPDINCEGGLKYKIFNYLNIKSEINFDFIMGFNAFIGIELQLDSPNK